MITKALVRMFLSISLSASLVACVDAEEVDAEQVDVAEGADTDAAPAVSVEAPGAEDLEMLGSTEGASSARYTVDPRCGGWDYGACTVIVGGETFNGRKHFSGGAWWCCTAADPETK